MSECRQQSKQWLASQNRPAVLSELTVARSSDPAADKRIASHQVRNRDIAPLFLQVLQYQPTMAQLWQVFAAQQTA